MFDESSELHFKSNDICAFFLFSSCTKGLKCRFLHDKELCKNGSEGEDPCYFFLKGKCDEGEKCHRSHIEPPCFNGTIKKICFYYSRGTCKRGKLCSYIHDFPDNLNSVNIGSTGSNRHINSSSEVPQVVINTSDDAVVDVPKPCRFYRRGMCFFGDHCKSFHDKPEKDLETLFSDLRKDEALEEMKEINKSEKSSNTLSSITTHDGNDINNSKVLQMSSNWNKDNGKGISQFSDKPSKSKEFTKASYSNSKKPKKSLNSKDSYTKNKSLETSNNSSSKLLITEAEYSSLNSNEFSRTLSSSLKYSKGSYRISKQFSKEPNNSSKPLFRNFNGSSKKKEYAKGNFSSSSKSKEFVDYQNNSLNSKGFVRHSSNSRDRNACISSKSRQFYRSTGGYSRFSNELNNHAKSRVFFTTPYNSYPRFQSEENNLVSTEDAVNSLLPREHSKNVDCSLGSKKFFKAEESYRSDVFLNSYNSNEQYQVTEKTHFSVNEDFIEKTEFGITRSMTRKQSKSQRKPKSENVQSRVIFKSKKL